MKKEIYNEKQRVDAPLQALPTCDAQMGEVLRLSTFEPQRAAWRIQWSEDEQMTTEISDRLRRRRKILDWGSADRERSIRLDSRSERQKDMALQSLRDSHKIGSIFVTDDNAYICKRTTLRGPIDDPESWIMLSERLPESDGRFISLPESNVRFRSLFTWLSDKWRNLT